MIEYIKATRIYPNGKLAVDAVSFTVAEGNLCVLLGPSGCGKTTLLRMTNRLVELSSGEILVDGKSITTQDPVALRRRIGYAIQGVGLFPHRTVAENIATTPELLGTERKAIDQRVDDLLAMMRLDPKDYRDRYPAQLSGGEAQRVGVARSLAADPPLLLMDEPFGALDPIARASIRDEFRSLQRSLRKTTIFVSHDITEALFLADTIALLRDGRLEQYGTPYELLTSPATPFVAEFLGDRAFLLLELLRAADALAPVATVEASDRAIAPETSLRDALLQLLESGSKALRVVDDHGTTTGVVTTASIARAIGGEPEATG
jgi:osmoprotectant transport system ATP-binding protein